MGCAGLMDVAWRVWEEVFVQELVGTVPNQYDSTIRGRPKAWGLEVWRKVYGFRKGGIRTLDRNEELLAEELQNPADPKEGYLALEAKSPEVRQVLGFLNPIFHPEKPKRVNSQ